MRTGLEDECKQAANILHIVEKKSIGRYKKQNNSSLRNASKNSPCHPSHPISLSFSSLPQLPHQLFQSLLVPYIQLLLHLVLDLPQLLRPNPLNLGRQPCRQHPHLLQLLPQLSRTIYQVRLHRCTRIFKRRYQSLYPLVIRMFVPHRLHEDRVTGEFCSQFAIAFEVGFGVGGGGGGRVGFGEIADVVEVR